MRRAAAFITAAFAAASAFAADDGFAAFWKSFSAAAGKNDKAALIAMTKPRPDGALVKDPAAAYARELSAKTRQCLARARPVKGQDGAYSAFCGEAIYTFEKRDGGWAFDDVGVND